MKRHIEAVAEALSHGNPDFLPRGELFISQPFLDRFFGDLRGNYLRQLAAAVRVMGLSLVGLDLNEGAPMPLPSREAAEGLEDCFIAGYINGPISRLIETHGFANAMKSMRKEPALFSKTTGDLLRFVENAAKAARTQGLMAIALADDIAGNNGLLFSFDYFANTVWPAYRAIAEIIKENGLRRLLSTRTATCAKSLSFSFRRVMTVYTRWTCRAASTCMRCARNSAKGSLSWDTSM